MLPVRHALPFHLLQLVFAAFTLADGRAETPIPLTTCVLDLELPRGAQITIDGQDYGSSRHIQWDSLEPGKTYATALRVDFANGKKHEQRVLLEGGRTIRLALADSGEERPGLVLQTGHSKPITAVAFALGGRGILTGAEDGSVVLWDTDTGRQLRCFRVPPLENSLLTTLELPEEGLPGSFKIAASMTAAVRRLVTTQSGQVCAVTFGPTGSLGLECLFAENACAMFDLESGTRKGRIDFGLNVNVAAFSPTGNTLLLAGEGVSEKDAKELRAELEAEYGHNKTRELQRIGLVPRTAVELFGWPSMRRLHRLGGYNMSVSSASFSADGRHIIAGGLDTETIRDRRKGTGRHDAGGVVCIWDADTGQELRRFRTDFEVHAVRLSNTANSLLASERGCPKVHIWDRTSGQRTRTLAGTAALFARDERQVLVGNDNKIRLVDIPSGGVVREFTCETGSLEGFQVSPDGRLLLAGFNPRNSFEKSKAFQHPPVGAAILWDIDSGRRIRSFEAASDPMRLATTSPDDASLLVCDSLFDTSTGQKRRNLTAELLTHFSAVFAPGSRRLLTANHKEGSWFFGPETSNDIAELLELDTGTTVQRLKLSRSVEGRAFFGFFSNGLRVLGVKGNSLASWSVGKAEPLWETGWESSIEAAAISPGQDLAAIAVTRERMVWWERDTGHLVEGPKDVKRGDVSSADGRYAVQVRDRSVELRDATTGRLVRTLWTGLKLNEFIDSARFGPEDAHVCAKIVHPEIVLLDVDTGRIAGGRECNGIQSPQTLTFSPNGRFLAVVGEGGQVHVMEWSSGRRVAAFHHDNDVRSIAFAADSSKLLVGCADRTILLRQIPSPEPLSVIEAHDGPVDSVAFVRSGSMILSRSCDDTTARLFDTATSIELARIVSIDNRRDWLIVTPEGLFDGSVGGREKVAFRVGGGLNVVPVDRFFQDFYYPGLLAAIWRGERPLPRVQFGEKMPPTIRIMSPSGDTVMEERAVTLEVEAEDHGGGIEGPWIRQNGVRVVAKGHTVRDGKILRGNFELSLVEGKNEIEVQAASGDGAWESEPARIVIEYQKPAPKSDLYLVCVGIDDYPGEKLDLKYPRGDAKAVADLFSSRGPELYANVYRTDLGNGDATKAGVLAAMQTVAGKASPRDTFVLFLAGHGSVVDDQYYFLPGDFEPGDGPWAKAVVRHALAAPVIGQAVTAVPALKRMLVFDTGQSGVVAKEATSRNPFAFRGAIERLGRAQGGFTIASCSSSTNAQEVSGLRHGVLTYSLLAGMKAVDGGPLKEQWVQAEEGDGVVRVLEWFGFADSHVAQLTEELFGTAQPVQHSSAGVSFPVLPIPAGDAPAQEPSDAGRVVKIRPEPATVESLRGSAGMADLYLLAVGINQYARSEFNLKYARPDAQAITDLFRSRGVQLYRNVHITSLLDDQATKAGITKALEEISEKAGPEDALMLYLSGHGKMVGQRYYLVTHEFKPAGDSLDDSVRAQCLAADEIGDGLARIRAKKRLLVFDTCASGGALGLKRGAVDPFAFRGAINRLGASQGTFAIAAAASSEEAQEDSTLGHGVLTYTLLAGLGAVDAGPLADRTVRLSRPDGFVDVLQWFNFASGQTPRLMKQLFGREQSIETSGSGVSFAVLPIAPAHAAPSRRSDERDLPRAPKASQEDPPLGEEAKPAHSDQQVGKSSVYGHGFRTAGATTD